MILKKSMHVQCRYKICLLKISTVRDHFDNNQRFMIVLHKGFVLIKVRVNVICEIIAYHGGFIHARAATNKQSFCSFIYYRDF